ncbi:hypothetical protein B649_08425 [Candidatus Sulfuricurvum sp. RIFRC-1]|uniref:polysaccharide deacetylase family protein n=1 Tax=Candidatus Sulfuricurvum sp. RIFRC-1 TaxID=1249480 RepID=UPI00029992A2|nr:polysaccharide deacetylase family protein [Candidatus Sulfuricurvum sp. RIFRC-1]AFV97997.1 hypothetical protein B649_08425 [Candidatus Sulfuricurvum sp. RIFRC-1]
MALKQIIKSTLMKCSSVIYRNDESKVIYYHDVHSNDSYTSMSTPLELFKKHIDIIQEQGYKIVDKITHPEREVLITFDDGFRGLYENFSYFVENQIPVKIFLIVEYMGGKNYLSKAEVFELLNTGLVTIGSHTLTHRNLDELTDDEIAKELKESKQRLEEMFGIEINEFCYPRGRFNDKVVELSRKSGYTLQYSCLPGSFSESNDIVKRNFVQHESSKDFLYHLQGGGEIFYRRYLKQQVRG